MSANSTGRPVGRPPKVRKSNLTEGKIADKINPNIPEAPKTLGLDSLKLWNQVWSNGDHLDKNMDYLLVETLCNVTDQIVFLRRALTLGKAGGGVDRTYTIRNQGTKASDPYFTQMTTLMKIQMSLMTEIGMTPAARAKMGQSQGISSGTELVLNFKAASDGIRQAAKEDGKL
jgi:P27 family predicted phage terminase small subunit